MAQNNLGIMYSAGFGVEHDAIEAVRWYRRAAEQGHPGAQNNLGRMYQFGFGIDLDYTEAERWYRLAAEQGFPDALRNLGLIYLNGTGLPRDLVSAFMWASLSVEQGNILAAGDNEFLQQLMSADEIAEALERASNCRAWDYHQCFDPA